MDTGSFFISIKTEDIQEDIADDIRKRFHASNYEAFGALAKGKNKKVALMKDELGGKIMTEFAVLRPKAYYYLMNDGNSDKKLKEKKMCNKKNTYV